MYAVKAQNITDAFYKSAKLIIDFSEEVPLGEITVSMKEVFPVLINIQNPLQRCLIIPERKMNPIAVIAETMWVLGGRNDVAYLKRYMPSATNYSYDEKTWRTAYGSRIRKHFGVDQLKEVYHELKRSSNSAQANIGIMDVDQDINRDKKAAPCTIWLHFNIRNGKLNTFASMRSNDLIWGFSHINFFEWSVVSEILAFWLHIEVGEYFHYTTSLRVFYRHYALLDRVNRNTLEHDVYSQKRQLKQLAIDISYESFDSVLKQFFDIEKEMYFKHMNNLDEIVCAIRHIDSQYLQNSLFILLSYFLFQNEQVDDFIYVFNMIYYDFTKIAVAEYYYRKTQNLYIKECMKCYFDLWKDSC